MEPCFCANVPAARRLVLLCVVMLAAACSRPAQTAAPAPSPPPMEYVDAWGVRGDGPGQLDQPVAIAADTQTNIYVADAGSSFVHKFSTKGEPRLSFQDGRGDLRPTDIAVDAGGAMYVPDLHRRTVVVYFSDGMHHRELHSPGLVGARESVHVGVDAYGTVFVTAKQPFGVRKFNTALRYVGTWGGAKAGDAAVENPAALAVGPDNLVYVNDAGRSRITVYDANGSLRRSLTLPSESASAQLDGIAVDAKNIFAVETKSPVVHVWSVDGSYRLSEDLSQWIANAAASPRKIAVTSGGELFVLEIAASRVFRFRLHL
jgi:sugar lactone lactonase YvrE